MAKVHFSTVRGEQVTARVASSFISAEQAVRNLTNADVQALAKKLLADGNLVKVIMRPAKEKEK